MRRTEDERRSARLTLSPELAEGRVRDEDLDGRDVQAALASRRVPSAPVRALQRAQMRRGRLGYLDDTVPTLMAARRAVLGEAAEGPPRVLVRVDALPHHEAWEPRGPLGVDAFRRFHAALRDAGVPYLVATSPRVSRAPLDPEGSEDRPLDAVEVELLTDLRRDGVAFALHALDHRTRRARPTRRSELAGLGRRELGAHLDRAQAELAEQAAIRPDVYVPPFERFDWQQWADLASRFSVVCGGPGSVASFGYHHTPLWRGQAVWMPAYPPLHGRAADVLGALRALAQRGAALWVPVVLDWRRELEDGGRGLEAFVREAGRWAVPWEAFLQAVRRSGAPGEA